MPESKLIKGIFGRYDLIDDPEKLELFAALNHKSGFTDILYNGCSSTERAPTSTSDRDRFRNHLDAILLQEREIDREKMLLALIDPIQGTTDMESLLGIEGLNLYKKAIIEEANSWEFRQAVFLKSMRVEQGAAFSKGPVIWIGGPSGAGKTYATEQALKHFFPVSDSTAPMRQQIFVMVDGGISRNTSQVRNVLLNTALRLGYTGILDLEKNTKIKIKDIILDASRTDSSIGIIIPDTFSKIGLPTAVLRTVVSLAGIGGLTKIREFHAEKRSQFFVEVKAPPGKDAMFREVVKFQGINRAFAAPKSSLNLTDMNVYSGIESKKYDDTYFDYGVKGSKLARKIFLEVTNGEGATLETTNTRQVIRYEEGTYKDCQASDLGVMILSQRDVAALRMREHIAHLSTHASKSFDRVHPEYRERIKALELVKREVLAERVKYLSRQLEDLAQQLLSSTEDVSLTLTGDVKQMLSEMAIQAINELNYINGILPLDITKGTELAEKILPVVNHSLELNLALKDLSESLIGGASFAATDVSVASTALLSPAGIDSFGSEKKPPALVPTLSEGCFIIYENLKPSPTRSDRSARSAQSILTVESTNEGTVIDSLEKDADTSVEMSVVDDLEAAAEIEEAQKKGPKPF